MIISRKPRGQGLDKEQKEPKVHVRNFSEVKMEPIDWLWYPYIPKGKITLLTGNPGDGKSFLTQALAAGLSTGTPLPGQEEALSPPRVSLMIAGEDNPEDTMKPRLTSLGANMDFIYVYDEPLSLKREGIRTIREMMQEVHPVLTIIDPIVAFLGADLDMHRANEVRPVLKALGDVAKEFSSAFLIVRHKRKSPPGSKPGKDIFDGMGSIDFTAASRSELQTFEASDGQKFITHVKTNVGPKGKSIQFSIQNDTFIWGQQVEEIEIKKSLRKVSKKFKSETRARIFLWDLLKNHPEGLLSSDVFLQGDTVLPKISRTVIEHISPEFVLKSRSPHGSLWFLRPDAKPILDPLLDTVID